MSGQTVPLVAGGDPEASATYVFRLLNDPERVAPAVSDWIGSHLGKPKSYVKMQELLQIRVEVPVELELNALKGNRVVPPVITKDSSAWTVSPVWEEYMLHPQTVATWRGALLLRLEPTPKTDPAHPAISIVEQRPGYPLHFKVDFEGESCNLPVSVVVQYAVWNAVYGADLEFRSLYAATTQFAMDVYKEGRTATKYKKVVASLLKGPAISMAVYVAERCVGKLADYMWECYTSKSSSDKRKEFERFVADTKITIHIPTDLRAKRTGRKRKRADGAFVDLCA